MSLGRVFAIVICFVLAADRIPQQATTVPPHYRNNTEGLERLIQDLREAVLIKQSERFAQLAAPLKIPKPTEWFVDTFGDFFGPSAASAYESTLPQFANLMEASFLELKRQGFTTTQVVPLKGSCDSGVTDHEFPVLLARAKPEPMYSVHFMKGHQIQSLGFFVYLDGAFRYVGHVALASVPANQAGKESPRQVKIGGSVQAANLIQRPAPIYPVEARQNNIQGTVRMQAVIGRDGSVRGLHVVSGHCLLAEAAVAAVLQWHYKPTLLEGQPVEVSTTIDVVYTLSR